MSIRSLIRAIGLASLSLGASSAVPLPEKRTTSVNVESKEFSKINPISFYNDELYFQTTCVNLDFVSKPDKLKTEKSYKNTELGIPKPEKKYATKDLKELAANYNRTLCINNIKNLGANYYSENQEFILSTGHCNGYVNFVLGALKDGWSIKTIIGKLLELGYKKDFDNEVKNIIQKYQISNRFPKGLHLFEISKESKIYLSHREPIVISSGNHVSVIVNHQFENLNESKFMVFDTNFDGKDSLKLRNINDVKLILDYTHSAVWYAYSLKDYNNFNWKDKIDPDIILSVAQIGDINSVKNCLKAGVSVNFKNKQGNFALHFAVQYNNLKLVKLLVKAGADVDMQTFDGFTSLNLAAQSGYFKIVKFLVKNKAKVDQQSHDEFSPLFSAAKNGHLSIVKCLIENGASKNLTNKFGNSALDYAIHHKHSKVVEFLFENQVAITRHTKYLLNESGLINNLKGNPFLSRYLA